MASLAPGKPRRQATRRAPGGLRRHIAWLLVAKLAILALLYACFFAPASRPRIDADAASQRMHIPPR